MIRHFLATLAYLVAVAAVAVFIFAMVAWSAVGAAFAVALGLPPWLPAVAVAAVFAFGWHAVRPRRRTR